MADQLPEIEVLLKQLTPLIARLQAESASGEQRTEILSPTFSV